MPKPSRSVRKKPAKKRRKAKPVPGARLFSLRLVDDGDEFRVEDVKTEGILDLRPGYVSLLRSRGCRGERGFELFRGCFGESGQLDGSTDEAEGSEGRAGGGEGASGLGEPGFAEVAEPPGEEGAGFLRIKSSGDHEGDRGP